MNEKAHRSNDVLDEYVAIRKRSLFRAGAVAVSLVAGLCAVAAVAEVVARRSISFNHDAALMEETRRALRLVPYLMSGCEPYETPDNADGTLNCLEESPYFGPNPWPKQVDVFMLGGSTSAGDGASGYEKTYFRIASRLTGMEIVSAGRPGYVSAQELNMLALRLLPLKPKRVVLLTGINDVALPTDTGMPPGYPPNWPLVEYERSVSGALLSRLGQKSAVVNLGIQYWMKREITRRPPPLMDLQGIARVWDINFTAMAKLCLGAKISLALVAQPNREVGRIRDRGGDVTGLGWTKMVAFMEQAARREGVPFLDATYAVQAQNFKDSVHPNDAGQRELAEILAAFLQEQTLP